MPNLEIIASIFSSRVRAVYSLLIKLSKSVLNKSGKLTLLSPGATREGKSILFRLELAALSMLLEFEIATPFAAEATVWGKF